LLVAPYRVRVNGHSYRVWESSPWAAYHNPRFVGPSILSVPSCNVYRGVGQGEKGKKKGSFFFFKNSLLTSAALLLLHFSVYLSTRCDNKFSAVSTTSSTASTYCACLAFKFSLVSRARQHGQHTTSTKKKNGHVGLRVTLLLLHLQRGLAAVLSFLTHCPSHFLGV
jgi:hypothetical protein